MEVTYKIIGGDGREYGPVTLDEMKTWIADGRVGAMTTVWRSDLERWAPALHFAEFQPQIGSAFPVSKAEAAGFWPRCAAYFLDFAIFTSIVALLWPLIASHYGWNAELDFKDVFPQPKLPTDEYRTLLILANLVRLTYEVGMNGAFGATVGKMALGLRIVRGDGKRIGYLQALLRSIGCRVSEAVFGFGFLFIIIRPDRRALHDLVAGTQVVYQK
jgi:uncharacterized RDD family membrane protein YckC